MTTLIVTLPEEPLDVAALYDYVLSPEGSTLAEQSRAPLALLPLLGKAEGEVVALVPAQRLSWHQVQLPKGTLGRRFFQEGGALRVRAVLDGLLEDRLLDDTAQLHFALEPQPSLDAPVWVAVCERAWLRAALQVLEQSGRAASRIVPEFPPQALRDTLFVTGEFEAAFLVGAAHGSVARLPLSRDAAALLGGVEEKSVVAEPAVVALAEALFQRSVIVQPSGQRQLQAAQSPWDLAQFDLLTSHGARARKRWTDAGRELLRAPRWRAARVAVLALLVVNLAGLNAWAWKEKSLLSSQRQAISAVLTTTFPQVRVVVDAPIQMARELAILQQASGAPSNRDLESMLTAFGAVAPAGTVPNAIEFMAGELRLKGLALSPEQVAALSFQLKPQGYVVNVDADNLVIKQGTGS
ncbi:MAG: general secretion pathway protein GspL [Gammaproteobacteria bacterium]|uniref:type II secretion system protein GspL n=1 Tax=Rhodoferax sp. TaxID=50421 RepID=UPI0017D5287F|nr:type II secretion system protein GspL [Rhodoferax sp.]MBU3900473.1 general secretion pathway protein GspL [Gammaproteobacteria bacterium]MBA3059940.1 general secretion pathway protein GspL [Rhodoferax sp.]MBU3997123.1 general secretion pathway protein GspL [Gammaproteobacteria bacterium]MBU4079918.1 general secretion pathway protein GspL [Gammaproteobacteria bacterium]MBU4112933.1 general secretion pathway protein GspL [Gammaproteobacteria bacterium]